MSPEEMADAWFELCEIAGKEKTLFLILFKKIADWQRKYDAYQWGEFSRIINERRNESSQSTKTTS